MKLTNSKVKAARPLEKEYRINDGNGLYLKVTPSGSKIWILRRKRQGKTTVKTLGRYPAVTLQAARLQVPALANQRTINRVKVSALADLYRDTIMVKLKASHLVEGFIQRGILPEIGNRYVDDIEPVDLARLLLLYKTRGASAASGLKRVIMGMFKLAVVMGYIPHNPARELSDTITGYSVVPRERVLTIEEIRALPEYPYGNVLVFMLLTGLRVSEALKGYRDGDRWIVPASLSKNGQAHWVHLPPLAVSQLDLPWCNSRNTLHGGLRRHDGDGTWTLHDLRRTYATIANSIGVDPMIVERTLNHTLPGLQKVYNKSEYTEQRVDCAVRVSAHVEGLLR